VKKKHFIFIIKNNNNNRKHIKIKNKKDKSFKKKLKHEPNIVEITHLCIRHEVHTSICLWHIGTVGYKTYINICFSTIDVDFKLSPCIPFGTQR
jgi:hypothetical protein